MAATPTADPDGGVAISLAGKTAIVTGASQGLGLVTARLLYRAGASVVLNYLDDPAGMNRGLAEGATGELGERAIALAADVREAAQVRAMFDEAAARLGGLDIVVNNAAILRDRTLRNMTEAEWQSVIDTNLTGVFHVCQAAGRVLRDGGRIVNLASISGVMGFYGQANYAAAKAGVMGLTKVVSRELAARGITANAVAPGVVLTEMGQSIPEQARGAMLAQIPLGRFGEPDEIAQAILFLCSDLASYITGQTLHVNGGWWG